MYDKSDVMWMMHGQNKYHTIPYHTIIILLFFLLNFVYYFLYGGLLLLASLMLLCNYMGE